MTGASFNVCLESRGDHYFHKEKYAKVKKSSFIVHDPAFGKRVIG
jgi:hypothetical protein